MLPTFGETQIHNSDAKNIREEMVIVEHKSDLAHQTSQKLSIKEIENTLPAIGESQLHESNAGNSGEEMVEVEHKSDLPTQTSPKPSNDMFKDTDNMPLMDEEVEGSKKKDEANEELQDTYATKEVQEEGGKETGKAMND